MRTRWVLAILAMATVATPAAQAQQTGRDSGIRTETQERLAAGSRNEFPWDLLGLFGLLGVLGLRRPHADDSYHPAPLE